MAGPSQNAETYSGPIVEINLDALRRNYEFMRDFAASAETAAVVKCDAYGLGLDAIAPALAEAGCKSFFVAYAEEGRALRRLLSSAAAKIYVLHGPDDKTLPLIDDAALTPVLNSVEQARLWHDARPGKAAAIKLDTGMHRMGLELENIEQIAVLKSLNIEMVMSHLACASTPSDPMNARQGEAFSDAAKAFPDARRSLAASGGVLLGSDYHFDLTRPGIALFGGSPLDDDDPRIETVATLSAPIRQIRDVRPGESVGYGATFVAESLRRIAVVSLGYGDGFLRGGSDSAFALVNGAPARIAGRISMDLIALDISDCGTSVSCADRAVFFGDGLRLHEAAAQRHTIPYELLTGLGGRVVRRYVGKTVGATAP